jgi:hypothetical protein
VTQGVGPEFKPPYHKRKKERKKETQVMLPILKKEKLHCNSKKKQ